LKNIDDSTKKREEVIKFLSNELDKKVVDTFFKFYMCYNENFINKENRFAEYFGLMFNNVRYWKKDDIPFDIKMKMINDVIREFDWENVKKIMENLDWKWYNYKTNKRTIPTYGELFETAFDLLVKVMFEHVDFAAYGGFEVSFEDGGLLTLKFVLAESVADFEEYDEEENNDD